MKECNLTNQKHIAKSGKIVKKTKLTISKKRSENN